MSTIVTRSGKGSPLTHTEVDNNFTNLNTDKLQSGDTASSLVITSADINGGSIDGATIGASTASTGVFTSLSDSGNLTFTGTGNRITGDFSNATIANRVAFQTSTTNANTTLTVLPNGTGAGAFATFYQSSSDPANTSVGSIGLAGGASVFRIENYVTGAGAYFPITFNTGGSERLRIDTSGNVGIGTSSPAARLQITGSDGTGFAGVRSQNSNANLGLAGIEFSSDTTYAKAAIAQLRQNANGNGPLVFYVDTNADAANWATGDEKMRIGTDGNVGIGLTNPGIYGQLEVGGSANTTIALRSSSASGTIFALTAVGSTEARVNAISNVPMTFYTNNTERMRIDSSGNVGIGTSSPSSQLHLSKASGTSEIRVQSGSSFGYMSLDSSGNYIGTGTAIPTIFTTNNTERMRIFSDGDVSIGSTGSPAKLYAIDSANQWAGYFENTNASLTNGVLALVGARNTTNSTWKAITYYNSGAAQDRFIVQDSGNVQNINNSYGAISDIKLKENIVDATPKLADLCKVKVRQYNLKSDPDHKQIGVIAQELEEVFSGLVEEQKDQDREGKDLGTTTKSVKYSVFVPMLIKAIQEQQAIITDLKARIETLESK